jgi:hypothetical protein
MCWYKQHKIYALLLVFIFCYGCKPEVRNANGSVKYFDIKKYFTDEAAKLTQHQRPVAKTVSYNGSAQTKTITIKNWMRELDLFTSSDINKAAWKDLYTMTSNADSIVYTAIDTSLHTRRVLISLKANKITGIQISNFTKNWLYQTKEVLVYYPDSLYYIEKHQAVKLMGVNNYIITGKLK